MTTKICLILGGTGGLGAASAYDFAKDYTIIAGRNRSKVDAITPRPSSRSTRRPSDTYGRIDVVLNAGGTLTPFAKLVESDAKDFDRAMTVNVKGTYLCMQEQVKAMLKNAQKAGGSIVNYSPIYGLTGQKWNANYGVSLHSHPYILTHPHKICRRGMSKHALINLTRSAALDYALDNVRTNAVAPDVIPTEMTAVLDSSAFPEGEMRDDVSSYINAYPQRRLGSVEDCARGGEVFS